MSVRAVWAWCGSDELAACVACRQRVRDAWSLLAIREGELLGVRFCAPCVAVICAANASAEKPA